MSAAEPLLGVVGGTGLYAVDQLEGVEERWVDTPFGRPSDAYVLGKLAGRPIVFLPRHGREHRLLPSELNYRANIFGFKKLGVTHLVSVSAVGSMREPYEPGHVVVVDQFYDRTRHRPDTFFGNGLVAHVSMAHPTCPVLSTVALARAAARRRHLPRRRHLHLHRRPAVLDPLGVAGLPIVGGRRHRHDQPAGGEARA